MTTVQQDPSEMEKEETKKETDKKCPSCGGTMEFDPKTGNLKCPYCGHEEEIKHDEDKPNSAEELDLSHAEDLANCDWGAKKKQVICKNCGAQSVYDELEIAGVCPYCGSTQVMEEKEVNTMAPQGVVPFAKTDKEAQELFKNWIGHKWFMPKDAKLNAKADKFKGVYLPYWTFDANTESSYTAQYGRQRTVRGRDGKPKTVVDWYNTRGRVSLDFDDVPIAATTQQSRAILSSLEPFDTAQNKTYKPEYLAGFIAQRYQIGLQEAWPEARSDMRREIESKCSSQIMSTEGSSMIRSLNVSSSFNDVTYKYLLLPVWLSSFSYNNKVYQFMVNGQTGKVGGKTPVSPWKVAIVVIIVIVVFVAIFYAVQSSNAADVYYETSGYYGGY